MSRVRIEPRPVTGTGPAARFVGHVWVEPIAAPQHPGQRMTVSLVRFAPGAHTAWHSHALGQTLHVLAGAALIGTRDGTVIEALPGQTVYTPPGEEHWHGATPDSFMEHLAMLDLDETDADTTTWREHLQPGQYRQP